MASFTSSRNREKIKRDFIYHIISTYNEWLHCVNLPFAFQRKRTFARTSRNPSTAPPFFSTVPIIQRPPSHKSPRNVVPRSTHAQGKWRFLCTLHAPNTVEANREVILCIDTGVQGQHSCKFLAIRIKEEANYECQD